MGWRLNPFTGTLDHAGAARPVGTTAGTVAAGDDPQLRKASRDYVGENYQAFASRVAGKNPSSATLSIFVNSDFAGGTTFTRNPTLWCADIDLTCFSPWNSTGAQYEGGVLISSRHVLLADHYSDPATGTSPMVPGTTTIKFVSNEVLPNGSNKVYTRLVVALTQVGATDLLIATLAAVPGSGDPDDLPAAIRPARRLLPPTTGSMVSTYGLLPVLMTNAAKNAYIGGAALSSGSQPPNTGLFAATDPTFAPWTRTPPAVGGDSGSPIFFLLDGELCLDGVFHTPQGGDRVSVQLAAVNAILGPGYALTVPAMTTTFDPGAARSGGDAGFNFLSAQIYGFSPYTTYFSPVQGGYYAAVLTCGADGKARLLGANPLQSIRLKADGSAWEAYTPGGASNTDAVPEGSTNLYFTNARAAAAAPVQSVALTTPGVLFANPATVTNSNGAVTLALVLNDQPTATLFGNFNSYPSRPSFNAVNRSALQALSQPLDAVGGLTSSGRATLTPGALPASGTAGDLRFDGTHFWGWNGSAWKQLDN